MLPIVSGTTTERTFRTLLPVLLFLGLGSAFLWDGFIGYPRENAAKLIESLGLDSPDGIVINQKLTAKKGHRMATQTAVGSPAPALHAKLGPPSVSQGNEAYYLGPGGHLYVRLARDAVEEIAWKDAGHNDTDLTVQRWIAYILFGAGLVMAVQLVRVLKTRVVLGEDGLCTHAGRLIPFSAMTALRPARPGTKGLIDLAYSHAGRSRTYRLDDYVIKEYDSIVEALCERTGLSNPHAAARNGADSEVSEAGQASRQ